MRVPWIALLILIVLWTGLLLGVSFLATPVKFLAPSLTLPVALDVGRQTFGVFQWVEVTLAVCILVGAIVGTRNPWFIAFTSIPAGIVAVQSLWLLPTLDDRVVQLLSGANPAPSSLHEIYIGLDVAKLVLLAVLTSWAVKHSRA